MTSLFDAQSNLDFVENQAAAHAILHSPVRDRLERYLSRACEQLIELHDELGIDIEALIATETRSRPRQGGRVLAHRVRQIPHAGNLREKIGFINDIAMGPQLFLWRLIERVVIAGMPTPRSVRLDVLRKHLQRVHTLTGISDPHELVAFYQQNPKTPMPTSLVKLPVDGAVILSRYTEYPMLGGARMKRPDERAGAFVMRRAEADPPLSPGEREYLAETGLMEDNGDPDAPLPWLTGAMCWSINAQNFYAKLAQHYNQLLIAGPSGSTDGCLEVLELLTGFNVELATLCCVAWLCNRNDHSAWEVLLAALPYGLDYSSDVNAYAFVDVLLRSLSPRYF
jgi:hypothetical protein